MSHTTIPTTHARPTSWLPWVAVFVCALILVFGWFFLLGPEYQRMRLATDTTLHDAEQTLQAKKARLKTLQSLRQSVDALDQERLRMRSEILPDAFEPTEMISSMSDFAQAAGVELISIDVVQAGTAVNAPKAAVADSSLPQGVAQAVVTMNVRTADGSYNQLKQLLSAIESHAPLLDLDSLTFVPGNTSYALQLRTYYRETGTAQ